MKTNSFISIKFLVLVLTLMMGNRAESQSSLVKSGYVPVNGMKMYYEMHGQTPSQTMPLIVIHGAYMNIPSMGAIIPALAKTHQVYAVELQGHGRTNDINRPITYQNLADDVAAFMDAMGIKKADIFGYSMGAVTGLQLAFRHPEKVNKLVSASGGYDVKGWQPEFTAMIPHMTVEMFLTMPFAEEFRKLSPDPDGFRGVVEKLIQLEKEPMAWENEVRSMKAPVLIISGDADVGTLEHYVSMFRLLGGGVMGDMGQPLIAFIEPFLKGETPKGFFQN